MTFWSCWLASFPHGISTDWSVQREFQDPVILAFWVHAKFPFLDYCKSFFISSNFVLVFFNLIFVVVYSCAHVEGRGPCWVSSSVPLHLTFWDWVSCWFWSSPGLLFSQELQGSFRPSHTTVPSILFSHECRRFKFISLCLFTEHFIDWTFSQLLIVDWPTHFSLFSL